MKTTLLLAKGLLALVVALFAAELFLRLILSETVELSLWFSSGIHSPHQKYGYVFSKNYRGSMQHAEGAFEVPLVLNSQGFRRPLVKDDSRPSVDVVFLGGRSMMFGYGLKDSKTIPGQTLKHSENNLRVINTAWPGFGLYRNFHLYRDFVEAKVRPELVVISYRAAVDYQLPSIPADFLDVRTTESFQFFDGRVVEQDTRMSRLFGTWYYRSILVHKLARMIDQRLQRNELPRRSSTDAANSPENFKEFMAYLVDYFQSRNIKVLFVFLPFRSENPKRHATIWPLLPDMPWIDLQREMVSELNSKSFFALDHYTAETSGKIGQRIAREVDLLLGE